jgi:hypothetical protein
VDFTGLSERNGRMLLPPYRMERYEVSADLHGRPGVARYLMWEPRDAQASRDAGGGGVMSAHV